MFFHELLEYAVFLSRTTGQYAQKTKFPGILEISDFHETGGMVVLDHTGKCKAFPVCKKFLGISKHTQNSTFHHQSKTGGILMFKVDS